MPDLVGLRSDTLTVRCVPGTNRASEYIHRALGAFREITSAW